MGSRPAVDVWPAARAAEPQSLEADPARDGPAGRCGLDRPGTGETGPGTPWPAPTPHRRSGRKPVGGAWAGSAPGLPEPGPGGRRLEPYRCAALGLRVLRALGSEPLLLGGPACPGLAGVAAVGLQRRAARDRRRGCLAPPR